MDFITLLSLTEPEDLIAVNQDANAPKPQWPYNITNGGTGTTGGPPTTTGGTWTSLPIPGATTSTGNGNVTTSTGNAGYAGHGIPSGAIGNLVNTLNTVSASKAVVKDQMRITIQKVDGTQLVLEEQTVVTPQEIVGLSKFFMLMSCATTVFSAGGSGYNIKINWSEVVKNLSIERHFVAPLSTSGVSATNVLDITLFDPT